MTKSRSNESASPSFQINRLQTTAARAWAQRSVPPQIREVVLGLVTSGGEDDADRELGAVDKVP